MLPKIVTVLGARPQFIKAATVSRAIRETKKFQEVIVHTGQHYDQKMSDVFFDELDLDRPHHFLEVGSGAHGAQTGRMLEAVEKVLLTEKPAYVLVYGDTNSTIAGSLAAAKLQIPVAHVEAGLRSFNRAMPEEINRCVVDHVATWQFCPTQQAVDNLKREGITDNVHLVGDVMYDALLYQARQGGQANTLRDLRLEPHAYVLCTLHRAGNTDDLGRFMRIWTALGELSRRLPVVLPLHPRTRAALQRQGLLTDDGEGLQLLGPIGYLDMTHLEKHARLIVTDSGGVQKEAFFHGVGCVTLRDETEWLTRHAEAVFQKGAYERGELIDEVERMVARRASA